MSLGVLERQEQTQLPTPITERLGGLTFACSPSISDLAAALAVSQGKIAPAIKSEINPHFGSKYADLAAVWQVCRGPLAESGISVIQIPSTHGNFVTVKTILLHSSGQWIAGSLTLTAQKDTPHAVGSTITYARRYSLMAFVGIAPAPGEDDDGNEGSIRHSPQESPIYQKRVRPPAGDVSEGQLKQLWALQKASGWEIRELRTFIKDAYAVEQSASLSKEQYQQLCDILQKKIPFEKVMSDLQQQRNSENG